jgi:hypothetical protein
MKKNDQCFSMYSYLYFLYLVVILLILLIPDDKFLIKNRSYFTIIIILQTRHLFILFISTHKLFVYLLKY